MAWQKMGAALLGLATALTFSVSVAHAAMEDQAVKFKRPAPPPEIQAKYDAYMKNIEPVYYPPVPFGWQVVVGTDNSVSYVHANPGEGADHTTTIKMFYTRKTANMDAERYMSNYVYNHSCTNMFKQGTGFYTADCLESNTYAIVIGEVEIITGKKVFADRNIGNMRDRDGSPAVVEPAPQLEPAPAPEAPAVAEAPADGEAPAADAAAEEDEGFFSWLPFL